MLSHPANPEPEGDGVAAASSEMPKASGNRRRRLTVADVFGHFDREFFRSWFVDGPRLLLAGRFNPREGTFMVIAALPALLAVAMLTVPGFLFPTPEHQAFFHFAHCLQSEAASLVPVVIGMISSLFSLRFPLGS